MFEQIEKEAKKKAADLSKQRDERCIPAAQAILAITAKGVIADKAPEDLFQEYVPLVREVMDVLIEKGIHVSDINYIFRLVLQSIDILKNVVDQSLDKHITSTEEMFWGKKLADVTIAELDAKLKQKE